jgi:hypothetical protein
MEDKLVSDAILAEFKETRALAISAAVDAVSLRAVNLRVDLERALRRIAELEGQVKNAPAG